MATACLSNIDPSGLCRAQPAGGRPDAERFLSKEVKEDYVCRVTRASAVTHSGFIFARLSVCLQTRSRPPRCDYLGVCPSASVSLAALCIHANVHTWPSHVCAKTREAMTEPLTCRSLLRRWVRLIILKPLLFTPSLSPILEERLHLPTRSNPPPLAAIFCLSPRAPSHSASEVIPVPVHLRYAAHNRRGSFTTWQR